jgi:hypothetical protein
MSLMKMLSDDLQNKPGNRLGELTLALKLKGYDKQTIDIRGGQIDESLDLIRALIKDSNE